jgi:hypothetical protein
VRLQHTAFEGIVKAFILQNAAFEVSATLLCTAIQVQLYNYCVLRCAHLTMFNRDRHRDQLYALVPYYLTMFLATVNCDVTLQINIASKMRTKVRTARHYLEKSFCSLCMLRLCSIACIACLPYTTTF